MRPKSVRRTVILLYPLVRSWATAASDIDPAITGALADTVAAKTVIVIKRLNIVKPYLAPLHYREASCRQI